MALGRHTHQCSHYTPSSYSLLSWESSIMRQESLFIRNDLGDFPQIAEQIGHLNVAWAHVEFRVFFLFWLLSGTTMPLARAIFYSQRTTRARLDMTLAVAPLVLRRKRGRGTTADFTRLRKLLGGIGTISGERNKYVHDPWCGQDGARTPFQVRLGGKEVHGEATAINRQEISRLTKKLRAKATTLRRFYLKLQPKMLALHEKLGKPQTLGLEPAKKRIPPKKKKAKPPAPPPS
jgi:hypothetical protein